MNFKDEYRAANEQIHGDRTILAGITEKPKKIIYFKPAVGIGIAAAVCAITLLAYPYINLPFGNEDSPIKTDGVFLASEQEKGMPLPENGEEMQSYNLEMRKAAPASVAEPAFDNCKAFGTCLLFENYVSVYDESGNETKYAITPETVFVNQNDEEISRETAEKGVIECIETENMVAVKIIIK